MTENDIIKFLEIMINEIESNHNEILRIRQMLRDKRWEIINQQNEDLETQNKQNSKKGE